MTAIHGPTPPSNHQGIPSPLQPCGQPYRRLVIGVGQGGLEALRSLIIGLPKDVGVTVVVCAYGEARSTEQMDAGRLQANTLDIAHNIGRGVSLPVLPARDGLIVEDRTIYVIPPGTKMVLVKDQLMSFDEDQDGIGVAPFDLLLHALAASAGDRSLAVSLSGDSQDGRRGAISVRRVGGKMLVQDPRSSPCQAAPRAIIESDLASAIATPKALAALIGRILEADGPGSPANLPSDENTPACPEEGGAKRCGEKSALKPSPLSWKGLPFLHRAWPGEAIPTPKGAGAGRQPPLSHDDHEQRGPFDEMLERNQQMLESTIDTLLASNDALRRRTHDIRQENQRLAAANTALEDVATMIAHDLKAPLRAIDHLARQLERALEKVDLAPTAADDLHHMQLRLAGLHRLIDDLLTYARQDASHDAATEKVDLGMLIREVFAQIGQPAGLRLDICPPSLWINTRRIPLECILRNLLSHVMEHHREAAGSIQITMTEFEGTLDVRIADDADAAPLSRDRLGLAIAQQLLAAEGGRLDHKVGTQKGNTCRFTWPIMPATT